MQGADAANRVCLPTQFVALLHASASRHLLTCRRPLPHAVGAVVMAYGFYKVGQGNRERRGIKAEHFAMRASLVPFLQACCGGDRGSRAGLAEEEGALLSAGVLVVRWVGVATSELILRLTACGSALADLAKGTGGPSSPLPAQAAGMQQ